MKLRFLVNNIHNEQELQYTKQIKEYKNNLDRAYENIQNLQDELTKLQEEKSTYEKQLDQSNHEYERLQTELQNRGLRFFFCLSLLPFYPIDHMQNMTLNERDISYQSQIEDYQAQSDQSLFEIQNLQSELNKSQEEKTNIETQLNETINTLKHDHEKQYKELESEIDELNERGRLVHFFISLNFNFCFLRT